MTGDVRIALLGCGAIGEIVARLVYSGQTGGCRVVAAVDTRAERAGIVARLLDATPCASLEDALALGVDAVDIRLPHHLHADAALAAMGHGRHVLIEKPLATTLADGRRVVDAARRSGVVAAVAENYPHLRAVRATADALARGDLGDLLTVRTTRAYTLGGVWARDGWRGDGGPSSGILLDQGTHHTSLLRVIAGEIDTVGAQASGDTVLLTVRFRSGLVGQSLYLWGSPAIDGEPEATVFGANARIDICVAYESDLGRALWHESPAAPKSLSGAENYYDSHRLIVEDWVAAIAAGRAPLVTVQDALDDLAVVLAAATSVTRGGIPVEVAT